MSKLKIKGVIVSNDDQMVYDWFGIEATSPATVEQAISDAKDGDLEVEISSGGGSVYAGSDIYTALKQHKGNVTTRITGIAASAASVIAMAGKTVEISPTAQIMIHNVSSLARGDYRDLAHESEVVKNYNKTIANAYRLKTGMEEKAILDMMNKETWLTAQQAKEMGFVDNIMFDDSGQLDLVASLGSETIPRAIVEKIRNQIKSQSKEADFLISKNSPTGQEEPEAMTKDEYTEQKTALLDDTKAIEALDNKFEIEAKELANEAALKDTRTITNLETKSIAVKEAKTVEKFTEVAEKMDVASESYRIAYLKKAQGNELSQMENSVLSTGTSSVGYAVPSITMNKIIERVYQYAPLLSKVEVFKVPGGIEIPVEGTVADADLHTEGASITAAADTITQIVLGAYEITKLLTISKKVQKMTIDAFEAWLSNNLGKSIAKKINGYLISGTGSSQPQGLEKANTWGSTNSISVALAGSLTAQNIYDLDALLNGEFDEGAEWVMSKSTFMADFRPLQDSAKTASLISFEGKTPYVNGKPVTYDDRVTLHEAYLGNLYECVAVNMPEEATVTSAFDVKTNSFDYLGCAIFDSKVKLGAAVVKLVKAAS